MVSYSMPTAGLENLDGYVLWWDLSVLVTLDVSIIMLAGHSMKGIIATSLAFVTFLECVTTIDKTAPSRIIQVLSFSATLLLPSWVKKDFYFYRLLKFIKKIFYFFLGWRRVTSAAADTASSIVVSSASG